MAEIGNRGEYFKNLILLTAAIGSAYSSALLIGNEIYKSKYAPPNVEEKFDRDFMKTERLENKVIEGYLNTTAK